MKEKTKIWVDFAQKDFNLFQKLYDENEFDNFLPFLGQQSIEKLLKAILEEIELSIPKIHDLAKLYDLIPALIQTELSIQDETLYLLNTAYIESRYPSEYAILPEKILNDEDRQFLYDQVNLLYKKLIEYLNAIK